MRREIPRRRGIHALVLLCVVGHAGCDVLLGIEDPVLARPPVGPGATPELPAGGNRWPDGGLPPGDVPAVPCPGPASTMALVRSSRIQLPAEHLILIVGDSEALGLGFFGQAGEVQNVRAASIGVTSSRTDVASVMAHDVPLLTEPAPYLQLEARRPGSTVIEVSYRGETSQMQVTVLERTAHAASFARSTVSMAGGSVTAVDAFFYHPCGHWLMDLKGELISSRPDLVVPILRRGARVWQHQIELRAVGNDGEAQVDIVLGTTRATLHVTVEPTVVDDIRTDDSFRFIYLDDDHQGLDRHVELEFWGDGHLQQLVPGFVEVTSTNPDVVGFEYVLQGPYISGLRLVPQAMGSATVMIHAGEASEALSIRVLGSEGDGDGDLLAIQKDRPDENDAENEGDEEEEDDEGETLDPGEEQCSSLYLAYDGSASSYAMEEAKYRWDRGEDVAPHLAEAWNFLRHERLAPETTEQIGLLEVATGMVRRPLASAPGYTDYLFGMHVRGPAIDEQARPLVVLTLLVDVSSSMGLVAPGTAEEAPRKLDLVRLALTEIAAALAPGDIVNVITFDSMAKIEMEGAVYADGMTALPELGRLGRRLGARQGTSFEDAMAVAYKVARRHHAPDRWNQIVVLTDDDLEIPGATREALLRESRTSLPDRGIRWSSIGMGRGVREEALRPLADLGKGSYFTAITRQDVTRIFRERFRAILGPSARNISFHLDYPEAMHHTSPAHDAASRVKATDFPYGDEHVAFESFRAPDGLDVADLAFVLTISYEDPETGEQFTGVTTRSVAELLQQNTSTIRVAEAIHLFTEVVAGTLDPGDGAAILDAYPDTPGEPLFQEYSTLIRRRP